MNDNTIFADNGQLYARINTHELELRNMDEDEDLNDYGRECKRIHEEAVKRDEEFHKRREQERQEEREARDAWQHRYDTDSEFRRQADLDEIKAHFGQSGR